MDTSQKVEQRLEQDRRAAHDAHIRRVLEDIREGLDRCGIAHRHLSDSDLHFVIAYGYYQQQLSGQPFTFEGWLLALGVTIPAGASES
jgi:hypothetical protein